MKRPTRKRAAKIVAAWDIETDPFEYGREIKPFAWDFYDGTEHITDWNKFDEANSMQRFATFLESLKRPHLIYAHNGGKFDFLFLYKYFRSSRVFVIGSRIVSMTIGIHELRDSYAAVPVPLKKFLKEEIDYNKFTPENRYNHAAEIEHYLRVDTESLYKLITAFRDRFGDKKTMASAALTELRKHQDFDICRASEDRVYRQFYFGGRVQAFRKGIIKDDLKLYDVNSMYPYVMGACQHPVKLQGHVGRTITENTAFLTVRGRTTTALGCFAVRKEDGGIDFPTGAGEFKTTIHEYKTALEYGLFKTDAVLQTYDFETFSNFKPFVDSEFATRMHCREIGDAAGDIFHKLLPNSSYGKMAQDPSKFEDYQIVMCDDELDGKPCKCPVHKCTCDGWRIKAHDDVAACFIWSRKSRKKHGGFYNVAIGASITGAARSVLLAALARSQNAVYCDTDSITCHSTTVPTGDALGQWKLEARGHEMGIAGKKLYALLNSEVPKPKNYQNMTPDRLKAEMRELKERLYVRGHGYAVKKASKGAQLSASEIWRVASGGIVQYFNPAPSMRFNSVQNFINRRIQLT